MKSFVRLRLYVLLQVDSRNEMSGNVGMAEIAKNLAGEIKGFHKKNPILHSVYWKKVVCSQTVISELSLYRYIY